MPVLSTGATYAIGKALFGTLLPGGTLTDFQSRLPFEFIRRNKGHGIAKDRASLHLFQAQTTSRQAAYVR